MSFRGQRFAVLSSGNRFVDGGAFWRGAGACRRADIRRCAMGADDPEGEGPLQRPGERRLRRADARRPARLSEVGWPEADRPARRRHVGPYAGGAPVRRAAQHGQSGGAGRQAAAQPNKPQRRAAEAAGIADHPSRCPRIGNRRPGAGRHRAFGKRVISEGSASDRPHHPPRARNRRPAPCQYQRNHHGAARFRRPRSAPGEPVPRPLPGPESIPSVRRHLKECVKLPTRLKPASPLPLGCVRWSSPCWAAPSASPALPSGAAAGVRHAPALPPHAREMAEDAAGAEFRQRKEYRYRSTRAARHPSVIRNLKKRLVPRQNVAAFYFTITYLSNQISFPALCSKHRKL